jgi:hypothetical protein
MSLPSEHDAELAALFAQSRQEETWQEEPSAASAIWLRARADELMSEEIEKRQWRARPLLVGRLIAAGFAGAAIVLGSFQAAPALPRDTNLAPGSVALLVLVALPALCLIQRLWKETVRR